MAKSLYLSERILPYENDGPGRLLSSLSDDSKLSSFNLQYSQTYFSCCEGKNTAGKCREVASIKP